MTLSYSQAKVIYQGNGQNTKWAIPFAFLDASDLQIVRITPQGESQMVQQDFSIDLTENAVFYPMPGSQTPPLAQGYKLMICRHTPLIQQTDFQAQQNFDPFVLEEGYDKAMMIAQEQAEALARAVKFPAHADVSSTDAAAYLQNLQQTLQQAQQAEQISLQTLEVARQGAQTAAEAAAGAADAVSLLEEYVQSGEEAKQLAQKWAVQTEAEVVPGEGYGAKYYAAKAAADAASAASSAEGAQLDASAAAGSASAAAGSAAQASASATAASSAKTAAQSAQNAAESAQTQAAASSVAAASSAASASQSAQKCEELIALAGEPAQKDLSNVTSIAASSAVQTALNAKANKDLSNGTKATQANINHIMPDTMDYVVASYADANGNWYRKYKSGWVEQGGQKDNGAPSASWTANISFLLPFQNTKYTLVYSASNNKENQEKAQLTFGVYAFSVSGFSFLSYGNASQYLSWYACGQGAE